MLKKNGKDDQNALFWDSSTSRRSPGSAQAETLGGQRNVSSLTAADTIGKVANGGRPGWQGSVGTRRAGLGTEWLPVQFPVPPCNTLGLQARVPSGGGGELVGSNLYLSYTDVSLPLFLPPFPSL